MRRLFSIAATLLAVSALACASERDQPRDLLLVSLDTVRADRIGSYGRADAGTPTLDALAARGARFDDAMTPTPITLPSHTTLFTGQDPLRHRVRHNGLFALAPEALTLAERLGEAGFGTGAFVGSVVLARRHGLAQGFEAWTEPGFERATDLFFLGERPAREVNRDALAWLDTLGDERFFLFVHYMEPHAPFSPPEPMRARFPGDPYQGEIATADAALGELLEGLDARGRLARTLVFVTADHGEALGEHGELSHGIFLYQSTLRVPMLVAGPGVEPGLTLSAPVGLVDVTPTLLEAAGLSGSPDMDGQSLWPALGGAELSAHRTLYAETFLPRYDYGWSELRALRSGSRKFIAAPDTEYYALDRDPGETRNLVATEFHETRGFAVELADHIARIEAGDAATERIDLGSQEREALEALGYLAGRHADVTAGELPDPKRHVGEAVALERASRMLREGERDEAKRVLAELVRTRPAFLEARVRLLLVFILEGNAQAAVAEGRALEAVAADLPDGPRVAARAHLLLGRMFVDAGRKEEAAREYAAALAAPQPAGIHTLLAALYHDLGRRDAAIRVLRELEAGGGANDRARAMLLYLEGRGPMPPPASSGEEAAGNR